MRKTWLIMTMALALVFTLGTASAQDAATVDEVLAKVREAAKYLEQKGEDGVAEFGDKESRWTWKDTYVWVLDCDNFTNKAHPINPALVGADLAGYVDKRGNYFFVQFCEIAEQAPEKGGWVEYWWPKPGETEATPKVTYVLQVPGQNMQVAAGVYSELNAAELNEALK